MDVDLKLGGRTHATFCADAVFDTDVDVVRVGGVGLIFEENPFDDEHEFRQKRIGQRFVEGGPKRENNDLRGHRFHWISPSAL